jgi:Golgi SNAP receptor complex protein 2
MIASLSEILPEEKRRLHELDLQFNEVEKGSTQIHINDVALGLTEMSNRFDQLDRLVQAESKERREDCKRRISHLRNSHQHIKISVENFIRRSRLYDFNTQKKNLFGNADLEGGGTMSDAEVAENTSLNNSSRIMNDYLATGKETLDNLLSQRERLKSVKRKLFDILNYLGLSNTIIRVVEKRDYVDKLIVYGGMIVIILILILVYCYLR